MDLLPVCRRWRAALNASDAALAAASSALPARELAARRERLAEDRASALRLIGGIARDEGIDGRFLHVSSALGIRQLLGLRGDVAACVFDLDGVLTASAGLHVAAWARAFDELTLARTERTVGHFRPFNPRTDYGAYLEGRPRLDGVRRFLASRGIKLPEGDPSDPLAAATVHGLANRKNNALLQLVGERGVTTYEGSLHYLDFAREVGVHTAVVSASANTRAILERAGLASGVEACIDGNAIAAERMQVKPAPDTLLAACRALGVEPGEAAAFETSPTGVTAACAAGFGVVIGVDETGRGEPLRAAGAGLVVASLAAMIDRRPA